MNLKELESHLPIWYRDIKKLRELIACGKGTTERRAMLAVLEQKFEKAQEDIIAICQGRIATSALRCNQKRTPERKREGEKGNYFFNQDR